MCRRCSRRRPHSVALLRANVAALRELDRTAEMEEVAEELVSVISMWCHASSAGGTSCGVVKLGVFAASLTRD